MSGSNVISEIDSALAEADQFAVSVEQVNNSMRQLDEALDCAAAYSKSINEIAATIAMLAKGIQMVSINASIEAVRVGSAGNTFAVVADEVRRMGITCNQAVLKINDTLAAVEKNRSQTRTYNRSNQAALRDLSASRDRLVQHLNIIQYQVDQLHTGGLSQDQQEAEVDPLEFDPETMSTGVESIDDQHRKLFAMVNDLDIACRHGHGKDRLDSMLDFLGAYAVDHFKHEESIMEKHQCSVAQKNINAHKFLLDRYTQWRSEYDRTGASLVMVRELHTLLKKWLVDHIQGTDSCLRACIARKRASLTR